VFASGVVVGVVSHGYWAASHAPARHEGPKSPEEYRRAYVAEMKSRLKLDEPQTAKLVVILDETRDRYRAMRDAARPQMKAIQDEQVQRINEMLTAAQQAEYTRMRDEREQKRKAEETSKKQRH